MQISNNENKKSSKFERGNKQSNGNNSFNKNEENKKIDSIKQRGNKSHLENKKNQLKILESEIRVSPLLEHYQSSKNRFY
jgi:hypothetical protein